jgi:hypothetical protein
MADAIRLPFAQCIVHIAHAIFTRLHHTDWTLPEHCVTILLTSRGIYIKLQLCSLFFFFISSSPRKLTCYAITEVSLVINVNVDHVTSHFFTWKISSFSVSQWPCFAIRNAHSSLHTMQHSIEQWCRDVNNRCFCYPTNVPLFFTQHRRERMKIMRSITS